MPAGPSRSPRPSEQTDDALVLLFLCCHPALSPPAAVTLTLRAVGGLTSREIAAAYLLPEATIAQRISRAKRTLAGRTLDQPGDLSVVLRVLYLIFNEGYTAGVLAGALAQQRHGEYQVQAAIAALHDDAATAAETDWPQILDWYDELLDRTGNPLAALSRAVAVGEVEGPLAGLLALDGLDTRLGRHHRLHAVRAYLHERAGDLLRAEELFAAAARSAPSTAERDHLLQRMTRVRQARLSR